MKIYSGCPGGVPGRSILCGRSISGLSVYPANLRFWGCCQIRDGSLSDRNGALVFLIRWPVSAGSSTKSAAGRSRGLCSWGVLALGAGDVWGCLWAGPCLRISISPNKTSTALESDEHGASAPGRCGSGGKASSCRRWPSGAWMPGAYRVRPLASASDFLEIAVPYVANGEGLAAGRIPRCASGSGRSAWRTKG